MTTKPATTTTTCPAWCQSKDCSGEHWRHLDYSGYIPATGSVLRSDKTPAVPSFGVGLTWEDHVGNRIELWLNEHETDNQWNFHLEEAFELATAILENYVSAVAELPDVPMPWPNVYDSFRKSVEAIASRERRHWTM